MAVTFSTQKTLEKPDRANLHPKARQNPHPEESKIYDCGIFVAEVCATDRPSEWVMKKSICLLPKHHSGE